jgi:hypothetical protein
MFADAWCGSHGFHRDLDLLSFFHREIGRLRCRRMTSMTGLPFLLDNKIAMVSTPELDRWLVFKQYGYQQSPRWITSIV